LAGWFDERLDVGASGCSGDSEMWYRIIAEGWTCRYFPHLKVHHQHRKTKKELHRQLFAYMRGHVSSILVQYEKYGHPGDRHRVYHSLPRYYLNKIKYCFIRLKISKFPGILNEIAGAISGWRFYQKNKLPAKNLRPFRSLYEPQNFEAGSLVSVVIPCYNHAHYLSEAIESVLKQDYPHVEVIVVDDGSDDDTAGICRKYPDVKYLNTKRAGLSAARNYGVKNCSGQYVIFLDADDSLITNAISIHIGHFMSNPSAVFISGAHQRINEHRAPLPDVEALTKWGHCYDALLQGNYIAMEGSVIYRRELFHAFAFDTTLTACEDYDLNLRISRNFPTFTHINIVAVYRIHQQSMSADKKMMLQQVLRVLEKQIPFLQTSHEKDCYQKGVQNWKDYYSQKTPD
ncbi:MAG: glycosyltransferase, partial [Pedobacter sp.]